MSNRSRGEALAVGAEPGHERGLFFGRGEGRLERIAREEDALVRGEAALARGRVVARIDVAACVAIESDHIATPSSRRVDGAEGKISARAAAVRRPVLIGVAEEIRRVVGIQRHLEPLVQQLARRVFAAEEATIHLQAVVRARTDREGNAVARQPREQHSI